MAERQNASEIQPFRSSLVNELEDGQYHVIEHWFTAEGRGRRPDLPVVNTDRRLFLQLHVLRNKHGKTWKFVENILNRLFPFMDSCIRPVEFRAILDRCVRSVEKEPAIDNYKSFLSETALQVEPLMEHVRSHYSWLKRSDLLGNLEELQTKMGDCHLPVTKGLVVNLEKFRNSENLPQSYSFKILNSFKVSYNCSTTKARKAIEKVLGEYEKVRKMRYKSETGKKNFEIFMNESFIFSNSIAAVTEVPSDVQNSVMPPGIGIDLEAPQATGGIDELERGSLKALEKVPTGVQNSVTSHPQSIGIELIPPQATGIDEIKRGSSKTSLGAALRTARGEIEQLKKANNELKFDIKVLREEGRKKHGENIDNKQRLDHCQTELRQCRSELKTLNLRNKKDLEKLQSHLSNCQKDLHDAKTNPYYKRLKRKEDLFLTYESFYERHSGGLISEQTSLLKKTIKNLQTQISKQKKEIDDLRDTRLEINEKIRNLRQECDRYLVQIEDLTSESHGLKTKQGASFTDQMVKCVIQLVGEVGIPANRCSPTIQCVCQCLLNISLSEKDLPSTRSNLRFADRGNVICNLHLAESILESQGFDLHTDGTSRDARCYVGNQATLSTGDVMSFGYNMVATEDTQTLLDLATNILQELADIYSESKEAVEKEDIFRDILKKLVAVMSDRASVMKSFNKALDKKRTDILGDESLQLQFLYCSAHFLLGLSSEAEKTLKEQQKSLGKLGRDQLAAFRSFSSAGESAVSRLIRTGCDVIGPRGDAKNGCREAWEAYCGMKEITSTIGSYRSNRFNNFFEGASALHHHRQSIVDFFSNFRQNPNLKLKSVLADSQSDTLDALLTAVGILHYAVTGPYWKLITSQVEYLDLYKYFVPMREKFVQYSKDASPLVEFEDVPPSAIPDFSIDGCEKVRSLQNVTDKKLVQETLQKLFGGFIAVTDRQLNDFLPGGVHHDVQDKELRSQMKHCQLTNLTGEANLADLDFSMFTKRHATLHHRSFMNMMKRNKPITSWFQKKSKTEQGHILRLSAKKAQGLRDSHRQKEKEVREMTRKRLAETNKKLEENRLKAMQRKAKLTAVVKYNGGPCLHHRDVDKLLRGQSSVTAKKRVLNDEIQYLKVVMGAKDKLLVSSKLPWETVATNLTSFLTQLKVQNDQDPNPHANVTLNEHDDPADMVVDEHEEELQFQGSDEDSWLTDDSNRSEDESEVQEESEFQEESEAEMSEVGPKVMRYDFDSFKFSKQGVWVGVYYDNGQKGPLFYIGQVVEIKSEDLAVVNFVQACGLKDNVYKFPSSSDIEEVMKKYVFHADFDMVTTNGRMWSMRDSSQFKLRFKQYTRLYC